MIDLDSESQLRVNFLELCYINHITQDQVLRFQKILMKRIKDIEHVIDKHFKMIQVNIINDVKEIYERERKKRKKEGIELTIQQQI